MDEKKSKRWTVFIDRRTERTFSPERSIFEPALLHGFEVSNAVLLIMERVCNLFLLYLVGTVNARSCAILTLYASKKDDSVWRKSVLRVNQLSDCDDPDVCIVTKRQMEEFLSDSEEKNIMCNLKVELCPAYD